MKNVELYTDGACSGNPGPGGYGVILKYNGRQLELSQGFIMTTNNRMELRAIIAGLEKLNQQCHVRIYTDSKYIVDSVTKGWARKWKKNNWMRNRAERALNTDLWEKLLNLTERHICEFNWVKGHAGHEENERCDQLAVAASSSQNLIVDNGMNSH